MAVPEDNSRYILGLVGGPDCIRVQRADMVSVARAREAHAQAVITAWMEARTQPAPASADNRWSVVARRLRAARQRLS